MRLKLVRYLQKYPLLAVFCFLAAYTTVFLLLYGTMSDAAFIVCNLIPLIFALLFGMQWGIAYAVIHSVYGLILGDIVNANTDTLLSNGIPALCVTIILSGAIGRIRDLTTSLQHELAERRRYEKELQQHEAQLEEQVAERTKDLVRSNERLRQEIAEREKAEEETRRLEASLKRAEKMEAIGVLAGSVAHDLNNILSGLVGYPELLLLELDEESPLREALLTIRESGQRASAVVQDLLTMARRGITSRKVINLNDIVVELLHSAELARLQEQHPDVSISTNLDPCLMNLSGSKVHLTKALLNLVLNALEALEGTGELTISTANTTIEHPSASYEVLSQGEYVTVTVEDTGVGIPAEDLDRIFEPFYTSKTMGRSGTGLGMAIVWGTVKDHYGFIDITSEEKKGTTFTVFLPTTEGEVEKERSPVSLEHYRGKQESILVVDDSKMQRDLCVAILTRLGYSVASVSSGEEALEYLQQNPVDLVVLDMIMDPGIDGLETYQRILALNPTQKAIIVSGYSESQQVKQAQSLGAGAYLKKPYTLETLAVVIHDELHRDS